MLVEMFIYFEDHDFFKIIQRGEPQMNDLLLYIFLAAFLLLALALGIFLGRKLEGYRLKAKLDQALLQKDQALLAKDQEFRAREQAIRKDAVERSKRTLKGKGGEQLVPYLPGFIYEPSDARFLGSPVDLMIFKGNTLGEPQEVVFIEIKTGASSLSKKERQWRDAIQQGRVRWELLRV